MSASIQASPARLLVLVPVYSHAATLGKLLRELSAVNLSVLVVEDGSADGVEAVLMDFR